MDTATHRYTASMSFLSKTLLTWLASLSVAASAIAQSGMSSAEVRKVDIAGGKITLTHGEIKSLDIPPMTMVYKVRSPSMLAKLQPGDKVRFQAEKLGGQYTVTAIEPAR